MAWFLCLIGLQLPYVLAGIRDYSHGTLFLYGALFSALVIALRVVWVFPGAYIAYWIRTRLLHQKLTMPNRAGHSGPGLDWHARSDRARRRHRTASDPGGRQPVSRSAT